MDNTDSSKEQQAISHLKHGNLAGLADLVKRYQVKAVHAALLIVIDQGTAEEVVQEAFLQASRKIEQYDDRRPFAPWFMRIVLRLALKDAAKQKRHEPLDEPASGTRTAEWLIDPGLDPLEIAEKKELREEIWQALGQLSPNQRAAVVLRYFLDETESEMINELNRPLTTIKWWLHSARQRLQHILRPTKLLKSRGEEVENE